MPRPISAMTTSVRTPSASARSGMQHAQPAHDQAGGVHVDAPSGVQVGSGRRGERHVAGPERRQRALHGALAVEEVGGPRPCATSAGARSRRTRGGRGAASRARPRRRRRTRLPISNSATSRRPCRRLRAQRLEEAREDEPVAQRTLPARERVLQGHARPRGLGCQRQRDRLPEADAREHRAQLALAPLDAREGAHAPRRRHGRRDAAEPVMAADLLHHVDLARHVAAPGRHVPRAAARVARSRGRSGWPPGAPAAPACRAARPPARAAR